MTGTEFGGSIIEKCCPSITPPKSLLKKLDIHAVGKEEITEGRVKDCLPNLRKLFSFFRMYPDIYLDLIKDPNEKFNFYFYQRFFLRSAMRHRYMYATFPRAFSKSFLAIMCLYLRCIFYPNSKLFIVSGGKEQSTKIAKEKIEELWKFFPSLKNEIIEGHGIKNGSIFKTDYIKLVFTNGSYIDIVSARQSSRGGRRTSGLIEESAQVDGQILSEVIIPMMNISRRAAFGAEDPNDITNKSQIYITTAGDKGTYAYDKMVQFFLWSLLRPEEAICIGGSWRVPVMHGLLAKTFVEDLKSDGTYSPLTFAREYESRWGGDSEKAFFRGSDFDKCRVLQTPLWEAPMKKSKENKFIIAYDVGRTSDLSSVVVILLTPSVGGTYIKKIVNIFNLEKKTMNEQSIFIKQLYSRYKPEKIIIDANGLGIGLIDTLVLTNTDENTGELYLPFGVDKESDPKKNHEKYYQTINGVDNILYLIKANQGLNADIHNLLNAQIISEKVQFLIDDQLALEKFKRTTAWKTYSEDKKVELLKPYKMTKILRDQMLNLKKKEDDNTKLKKITSGIRKDIFSALEYGVYYARILEKKNKRKPKISSDYSLMSASPSLSDRGNFRDRIHRRERSAYRR